MWVKYNFSLNMSSTICNKKRIHDIYTHTHTHNCSREITKFLVQVYTCFVSNYGTD